uniref:Uncharacterized protein n=1 Tax=Anguilla anguilla TaxID=7936 RepID=A0A0E9VVR7_ANGAN
MRDLQCGRMFQCMPFTCVFCVYSVLQNVDFYLPMSRNPLSYRYFQHSHHSGTIRLFCCYELVLRHVFCEMPCFCGYFCSLFVL